MQKFIKSFRYAFEGILHAIKTERNFKIHLIAAVIVIFSGLVTGLEISRMVCNNYFNWRNASA